MRPLLATLLLLPALGSAQTLAIAVNGAVTTGTNTTPVLALNTCNTTVGAAWTGSSLTTACTSLQFWVTAFSCGTTPSTTNIPADVVVYTAQVGDLANGLTKAAFTFSFSVLPSFSNTLPDGGSGGSSLCGTAVDFTNTLCGAVTTKAADLSCTGSVAQAPTVGLRYDNIPPDPPSVTVTPLDSQLSVKLGASATTPATDVLYFKAQLSLDIDGGTPVYAPIGGNISATNPIVTVSGLTNGQDYLIQGFTVDEATNVSLPSTPVVGTPVLTLGFYANYLKDGGQPGGCGDTGGGGPSLLAFAGLLLLALVRRRG